MEHEVVHSDKGSRRQGVGKGKTGTRRVPVQANAVAGQKKDDYHWLEVSNLSGDLNLKGQEAADYLRKIGLLA